MKLSLVVLLPVVGALIPPLAIQAGRNVCTTVTAAITGLALVILLTEAPAVCCGGVPQTHMSGLTQHGRSGWLLADGHGQVV